MSEDLESLIEKINQEGVKAAEAKARLIEQEANKRAEEIIHQAQNLSRDKLSEAKEQIAKMEEKTKTLLVQAGRDLLLVLRKEINSLLLKIVSQDLRQALSPQELIKILASIIEQTIVNKEGLVTISLNKDQFKDIEAGLFAVLKEEVKKQVILRSQDDLHSGFVISFDSGKSQFDFSDKALASYIGEFLKPKLKDILDA
ncbi:MAG: hypothetical protein HY761_02555 [Candidatus Omnitrophica bacterium]|nr:hypothetical protein [Candidatus Omnitrophota bacterium]